MIDRVKIDKWFDSRVLPQSPKTSDQPIQEIRVCAKRLAEAIVSNTPASADQSASVRMVREAMQTAVQAIVCDG